jgi:hypothetical protein
MDTIVYVVVALVVGIWAGGSFARFKSARANLAGTKAMIPGLRSKFWNNGFHSVKAILALVGLLFVFFLGLRAAGKM